MSIVSDQRVFLTATPVETPGNDSPYPVFPICKRGFDFVFCTLVLLPAMLVVASFLILLNPALNPGPLFHRSTRMGKDSAPFQVLKFRTMRPTRWIRGPEDPLETGRITPLGRVLRRTRLDELPQVINVFRGEMSLIGPRPDEYHHAVYFSAVIPGYRQRHSVRPGITGLSQTRLGYAEGVAATRAKTAIDLDYIRHAGWRQEMRVFCRTILIVVTARGM